MKTIMIQLPATLTQDTRVEIAKYTCYCDQQIIKCSLAPDTKNLEIVLEQDADADVISDKVGKLIDRMKSDRLSVEPSCLKSRTRDNEVYDENVLASLEEAGDISMEGPGVVSRAGAFRELLARLDKVLEKIGVEIFGAAAREYNVLIPSDWLRRADYFSSFAHSLTFAIHLREDYDALQGFAGRHRENAELTLQSLDEFNTPEYCLSPAVCFHTYGGLRNSSLPSDADGLLVYTASGRCFRYESKNMSDLARLWEFTMREIVFVGEAERVIHARQKAMDFFWRLVELLDVSATLETASDPFFTTEYKTLRFFQISNELKYELRLPFNKKDTVAAASFNYHESYFGKRFGIQTTNKTPAHTGCAAFGIERLVYALIAQVGYENALKRIERVEASILGDVGDVK